MARSLHKLTAQTVLAAKGKSAPYTLADGGGLVLLVKSDGGKHWRFRYRYGGRANMLSFGSFPDTSLALARDQLAEARKLLAAGIDPSAKRRAEQDARRDTFEAVAKEYLVQRRDLIEDTATRARRQLETYVYPKIGRTPIGAVRTKDLVDILRKVTEQGKYETAQQVRSLCGRICRYARSTDRNVQVASDDLRGALGKAPKSGGFAAIREPGKVGGLMRAIAGYPGQPSTRLALQFLALTFVRPGELRAAKWEEFQLDGKEPQWVIPAARMKVKDQGDHIVPLSKQALAVLDELRSHSRGNLLFPSLRPNRCISENTLAMALRTIGYAGDVHVPHGFRKTASTLLHERGENPKWIEAQLAHKEPGVAGKYNSAQYLPQRRKMMQLWADYLDKLTAQPIKLAA